MPLGNNNLNLANLSLNVRFNGQNGAAGLLQLVGQAQKAGQSTAAAMNTASAATDNAAKSTQNLTHHFNLGSAAAGVLKDVLRGVAVGIGIGAWLEFERVISNIVQILPTLIEQGLQFAEKVAKVSAQTGASVQASSRLLAMFGFLNISTGNLAFRLGFLDRNLITHEKLLNELGITIRDANGHYLDTLTILDRVRSTLAGVTNGAVKSALEMRLLGRTASDMGLFFNLTDAQVKILNHEFDLLGITMDRTAVQEALKARVELNLLNVAGQGLANRLVTLVAPALTRAVDALVHFVEDNGKAIAQFASDVVNFVLGMISALTGAKFAAVTLTDALFNAGVAASGGGRSVDGLSKQLSGSQRAANGASKAIQDLIKSIDRQIAVTTKLENTQQKQYTNYLAGLDAEIDKQLALINAQDEATRSARERQRLQEAIQQAEQAYALAQAGTASGVNVLDVADAAQKLADARQALLDYEQNASDAARIDELNAVKAFIAQVLSIEKDSTNRKIALAQLTTREKNLESQIAAAKAAGDLQLVADLEVELEATKASIVRLREKDKNTVREDSLKKEKTRLQDLLSASRSTASGIGAAFTKGSNDAGASLFAMGDKGKKAFAGIQGGFTTAEQAGHDFGEKMKVVAAGLVSAFGKFLFVLNAIAGLLLWIINVIPDFVKAIQKTFRPLGDMLDQIQKIIGFGTPATTVHSVKTNAGGQITSWEDENGSWHAGAPPPGSRYLSKTNVNGNWVSGYQGYASGGDVTAGVPVRVNEAGPGEVFTPRTSGHITPAYMMGGSGQGLTVHIHAQVFTASEYEARKFARALWEHLDAESVRRGRTIGQTQRAPNR